MSIMIEMIIVPIVLGDICDSIPVKTAFLLSVRNRMLTILAGKNRKLFISHMIRPAGTVSKEIIFHHVICKGLFCMIVFHVLSI